MNMVKKIRIYHPFLSSLYPLLAFYSNNKHELSLDYIVTPLLTIFLTSTLYYFILRLIFRNKYKAGIAATVTYFMFFSFGHMIIFLKNSHLVAEAILNSPELILFWLLFIFAVVFFISRSKKSFTFTTGILNIFSVVLVIISISNIGYFELNRKPWNEFIDKSNEQNPVSRNYCSNHNCPDVYYIIVERYGNKDALKGYFSYDNSDFISFLENQGFAIFEKSKSNYLTSYPSLASSLTMDYLDELARVMGENNSDQGPLYNIYRDNKIWRFLKTKGYKFIFVGSYWEHGNKSEFADINYKYKSGGLSEFSRSFLETTMFYPFLNSIVSNPFLEWRKLHYELSIDQFDKLEEFSTLKGPKYVFAHLFVTHTPYVFDKSGKLISAEEEVKRGYKNNYVNAVIFANKKLKNLIEKIQQNSGKRAVIILQADEGPYPERIILEERTFNFKNATREELKTKTGILNAYYLPNVDRNIIYPGITPVNTFRLIFNIYFNENLPLLPDKTYAHQDEQHPYKFWEITKSVN